MAGLLAGTVFDRPPHCERCDLPEDDCKCLPLEPEIRGYPTPATQTAVLSVEKRKRGKMVTVVRGLSADDNDLPGLLAKLKTHCGAGGTLQDDSLEIQGKHMERLRKELNRIGYKTKG